MRWNCSVSTYGTARVLETGKWIASDRVGWWVADAAPAGGEHAQRKDRSDAGEDDGAGD